MLNNATNVSYELIFRRFSKMLCNILNKKIRVVNFQTSSAQASEWYSNEKKMDRSLGFFSKNTRSLTK